MYGNTVLLLTTDLYLPPNGIPSNLIGEGDHRLAYGCLEEMLKTSKRVAGCGALAQLRSGA